MTAPFNEKEQAAWDLVGEAFEAIMTLDPRGRLKINTEELARACHVWQDFIKQHTLHRLWPEAFADWYAQDGSQG